MANDVEIKEWLPIKEKIQVIVRKTLYNVEAKMVIKTLCF